MKKRTRLFLVVAVGVLVLGLGTGLLAAYVGVQNFTIIGGNGPDELAYIPAEAQMVAFADVRDLVNSEVRQKFSQFGPPPDAKNHLEAETGIDIERDVERIVVAGWSGSSNSFDGPPLLIATGSFDADQIETTIRQHGGTVEDYKGKQLLVIDGKVAVSFVEPGVVAAGQAANVRKAIDTKLSGTGSVTGNGELMKLIKDVNDGNAWAVARFDALATSPLPREIVQQLPPITWLAASGHVDNSIRGALRVEAKDEKSAQDLREVVRGFMALARLQAGQRPEFAELINSLELGGTGTTVSLGFSVPAGVLDILSKVAAERRQQAPDSRGVVKQERPREAVPSL